MESEEKNTIVKSIVCSLLIFFIAQMRSCQECR